MPAPASSTPHLESLLAAAWPPADWRDVRVVVAVSGGADSVALLRALGAVAAEGQRGLVVAHFNHLARPDAALDAEFVRELSAQLKLPCKIGQGVISAAGDGWEAAARRARYAFLRQVAHDHGARYVAVAHTADDQAETVLHRIVRGTGVAGLRGMPRARKLSHATSLIRPLLDVPRAETRRYLQQIGQEHREDSTNADPRFTRTRIRHQLIPSLQAGFNPQVTQALLNLSRSAAEIQDLIDAMIVNLRDSGAVRLDLRHGRRQGAAEINCQALAGEPPHMVREFFVALWKELRWPRQAMATRHWQLLADLALPAGRDARITLPGGVAARRSGGTIRLHHVARAGDRSEHLDDLPV